MSVVTDLITNAQAYADTVTTAAEDAMSSAVSNMNSIGFFEPYGTPATLPSPPPTELSVTLPTFEEHVIEIPSEPAAAPEFDVISPFASVSFPTFSTASPTLSLPDKPSAVAAFTAVSPTVSSSLVFPDMPSALTDPFPASPILTERTEPTAPSLTLPAFTAIAPVDTTVMPSDHESRFTSAYASMAPSTITMMDGYVDAMLAKYNPRFAEQMAAIEAQLATYMAGGTGLKAAVEDAIYTRSRSKADAEARRVQDANWADAATRGFTLPTGALTSGNQTARQAAADINATAAREIVVMQAEMEQKNLQFAVTTSAGLRSTLLSASLSYLQNLTTLNSQALDYAKNVLSAIIEVYNTAVKAYGIKLDAYKVEAAIHETKLRSAMATIELYRAEIDALQAMTQVDRAKVDIYKARIETLNTYASVWKAQIDAVLGEATFEKVKVDLFQSEVQAFGTLVQSKNAEWQGYQAQIEGQLGLVKVYESQVGAFNARVNAVKAEVEAKTEVVRALAATNQAKASNYSAVMQGYSTQVQARALVANSQIENERQKLTAFSAEMQLAVANANVYGEYYRSTSNAAIANARISLEAGIASVASRQTFGKTLAELGHSNAQTYAQLASAAMSGMNSLASQSEEL